MNVTVEPQIRIGIVMFVLWNLALGVLFLTALPYTEVEPRVVIADKHDYSRQIDDIVLSSLEQLQVYSTVYLTEENVYQKELFDADENVGVRWTKFVRRLEVPKEAPFIVRDSLGILDAKLAEFGAKIVDFEEGYVSGSRILNFQVSCTESVGDMTFHPVVETVTIVQKGVLPPHSITGQTGKIAIVVDDVGYRVEGVEAFIAISRPLSFAALPGTPFVQSEVAKASQAGYTVLLHLPMEPLNSESDPGSLSVSVSMAREEIEQIVLKGLEQVPGAIGVNNHMGSRATADVNVMRAVLSVLSDKGLFFLDSRTTPVTVSEKIAEETGIAFTMNDFFLDNKSDVEYIKERIRTLAKKALRDGYAIGILHDRRGNPQAIASMIDELETAGIELVYVEELIDRGSPEQVQVGI
jgi:polysaccharide deacetylase 2 family uncharacterized protein YibQ